MNSKFVYSSIFLVFILFHFISCNSGHTNDSAVKENWKNWSKTPPMGWNSYDCYGGSINEEEFKKSVDILSEKMLPFGYEYAVIDIAWYEPNSENLADIAFYNPVAKENVVVMDEYGRAMPAPDRFPSAANGVGFKGLADYTHSKGMKFGIHIMRGIPRAAVRNNLPIHNSTYFAQNAYEPWDSCQYWNSDNWGVDYSKPAGQEYYNSIFQLYADWGVDFIKADDMMVPKYHKNEIEMMRKAIDKTGRPMVLSLSCGESQVSFANHLVENANMWRIAIDIWDRWSDIKRVFELSHVWSPFIGNGTWPDADMIPIGRLSVNSKPESKRQPRKSMLTETECQTVMSLWSISASPLMWGGDPISTAEEDYRFLTNKELIEVTKNSNNNRQIFHRYGRGHTALIWFADIKNSEDKYFALFNIDDKPQDITFNFEYEYLRDKEYAIRDLWAHKDLGNFKSEFTENIPAHGSGVYKVSKVN